MDDIFYQLARKIRPDLENLSGQRRMAGVADVIALLYTLPLAVIGLVWLARISDWRVFPQHWAFLALLFVLMFAFSRFSFFINTEIRTGGYANTEGALDGVVLWTGAFLFGPTALWLPFAWDALNYLNDLRRTKTVGGYWSRTRLFTSTVGANVLAMLIAYAFYRRLGGQIPLPGLTLESILPAMAAIFAQMFLAGLVYMGYIAYVIWALKNVLLTSPRPAVRFFALALALPTLAIPFAILAAGLYQQQGLMVFMFLIIGLLLVAILARQLSQAVESSRQQSRQLDALEKLGRAILNAPPDASKLPEILEEHIPAMFTARGVAIWCEPRGTLLRYPVDWALEIEPVWKWMHTQRETRSFLAGEHLPWQDQPGEHSAVILSPILDMEQQHPIGGIYLELQPLARPWDSRSLAVLLPAVQSLSAQVASALHQAQVYAETLVYQKTLQEITLARQIQASFLPAGIPIVPGWQLTASLEPARQMAGDYYDFISLPNGRLGILIADVADKGLGPALYMALSSTLIRTFAIQYPDEPAAVLTGANRRILSDARANLFVTVFYGVLDPQTGLLTYANAGHTPPYVFSLNDGDKPQVLRNTGMPLGIEEENVWRQEVTQMVSGDVLLLYTDGVTDAQNARGDFIDRHLVLQAARDHLSQPIAAIQEAILEEVHRFVGDAPRFDDITLVILKRD